MAAVYGVFLGIFLGSSLFFVLAVGRAFSVLPGQDLAAYLGALFPLFYGFTGASALAAALVGLATRRRLRRFLWPFLAAVLQFFGWAVLLPIVHRAIGTADFARWHGISLGVAALAFLAGVVALLVHLLSD